jgi:hypothetical protein
MTVNHGKSGVLVDGSRPGYIPKIGEQPVPLVQEYKYLGINVGLDFCWVERLIRALAGNSAFASVIHIVSNKR